MNRGGVPNTPVSMICEPNQAIPAGTNPLTLTLTLALTMAMFIFRCDPLSSRSCHVLQKWPDSFANADPVFRNYRGPTMNYTLTRSLRHSCDPSQTPFFIATCMRFRRFGSMPMRLPRAAGGAPILARIMQQYTEEENAAHVPTCEMFA